MSFNLFIILFLLIVPYSSTLIALQAAVARKDMAVATSARNFMRVSILHHYSNSTSLILTRFNYNSQNFGGTIALAVGASVM